MMLAESIRLGGRTVGGFLGADTAPTQSAIVSAVLAYRGAWDAYVLGVLRNMTAVANSFDDVATHPPAGFTADELKKLGATYRSQAQALLTMWNEFAGLKPSEIEEQSSTILKVWEDTLLRVSNLAASEKIDQFAGGVKWPDPPSADVQRKVLTDLQAVAVDVSYLGILNLLGSRALQKTGDIANAVIEGAGAAVKKVADDVIPWQVWVIAGVALTGAAAVVILVYMPTPHRRPA